MGSVLAEELAPLEVEHIHCHHGYFASWMALVAARLLGIDFSITLHGSDLLQRADLLEAKLRACKFCVTVSEFNRQYLLRNYPSIARRESRWCSGWEWIASFVRDSWDSGGGGGASSFLLAGGWATASGKGLFLPHWGLWRTARTREWIHSAGSWARARERAALERQIVEAGAAEAMFNWSVIFPAMRLAVTTDMPIWS